MSARNLTLPSLICALLTGCILVVTAIGWGFRGPERSLPMPSAIAAPEGMDETSEAVFQTIFETPVRSSRLSLLAVGPTGLRVRLDQELVGSASGASPAAVKVALKPLGAGEHVMQVVVPGTGSRAGFGVSLDILLDGGERMRVVSGSEWTVSSGDASGPASRVLVVGDHDSPRLGGMLAELPPEYHARKEPIFWATLGGLLGAVILACFAGPVIRPASADPAISPAVGLAAIVPSFLYVSAAFLITGLSGLGATVPWVLGLHVVSVSLFLLMLVAIGSGGRAVDRDNTVHRAQLAGYDTMLGRMEVVVACINGLPTEARGDWVGRVAAVAERMRFAATTIQTVDIDRAILAEIDSLDRFVAARESLDAVACRDAADRIEALLLRREAIAAAAQRIGS